MNRFTFIRILSYNIVVFALLMELGSWAYVSFARPNIGYLAMVPTYLDMGSQSQYEADVDPLSPHIIDSTYPWSTWHPRNVVFRHHKSCFDVLMRYNDEGTRGSLPDPTDSSTTFFVGDSFTEGYGLSEDSTLPALYGRATGQPVLNLGSSGYVGTTQYSLIYSHFADRYHHGKVHVMLYLANDFMENDIDQYGALFAADKRYRPYRGDTANLDALVYKGSPDSSLYSWAAYREARKHPRPKLIRMGMEDYWRDFSGGVFSKLFNLTYSRRLLRVIQLSMERKLPEELQYRERDLRILERDIQSIIRTAERHGAQAVFTNLPGLNLMEKAGKDANMEGRYLELEQRISKMVGSGKHRFISYYRHLRETKLPARSLVFACDAHYNPEGMWRLSTFLLSQAKGGQPPRAVDPKP